MVKGTIFEETIEKILLAANEFSLPAKDVAMINKGLLCASNERQRFKLIVDACEKLASRVALSSLFENLSIVKHGWTSSSKKRTQQDAVRRA